MKTQAVAYLRMTAATLILGALLMPAAAGAEPVVGGFIETAHAVRVERNEALGDGEIGDRTYPRSEFRMQATARDESDLGSFFARIDFLSDASRTSRSSVDVREAYVKLYPARWLDIKLGRLLFVLRSQPDSREVKPAIRLTRSHGDGDLAAASAEASHSPDGQSAASCSIRGSRGQSASEVSCPRRRGSFGSNVRSVPAFR